MTKPQDKRVLVVDDDEDVVFFLTTALEDAGFQVDEASGADEALERIRTNPPDFISLDMVMPGKSGVVLFHTLQKNPDWAGIPVLFVTGEAKNARVRQELDAVLTQSSMHGPDTYLEKPVTAAKYVRAIAKVLGIELQEEGDVPRRSALEMRGELEKLAEGADPEALQEALRLLRDNQK